MLSMSKLKARISLDNWDDKQFRPINERAGTVVIGVPRACAREKLEPIPSFNRVVDRVSFSPCVMSLFETNAKGVREFQPRVTPSG